MFIKEYLLIFNMTKRIVLTGGLVTGKSALLRELKKRGLKTHSELYQTTLDEVGGLVTRENTYPFIQKWFSNKNPLSGCRIQFQKQLCYL